MIVLDLEWNSGRYGGRLNEILQIGAVKLDRLGGRITGSFCAYVRPKHHKTFSPAAASLPELALARTSETYFPQAIEEFLAWCGEDGDFAAWGTSDFLVLQENFRYWKLEWTLPACFYDLQAAFTRACGSLNSPALEPAAAYCGIPETFDFHNALYDALYTALIGACLRPEEVEEARREPGQPVRRDKSVTRLGLPRKKNGLWSGPFPTVEAALNSRSCRRGECPRCGAAQRAGEWASDDGKYFYAQLTCPAHGPYILRLETAWDKKKRMWGFPEVGETTPSNLALLKQARAGGSTACGKSGRAAKRPRRRRRRRKKAGSAPESGQKTS